MPREPLRIMHVLPGAPFGGVQVVALQLAEAQRQRGHAVKVIFTNRDDHAAFLAQDAGLDVEFLGSNRFAAAWQLANVLATDRLAIVHSHCEPFWASATLALRCPQRWVVHLHVYPDSRVSLRKSVANGLQKHAARFFIASSNSVRDVSVACGLVRPQNVQVAYNGLSFPPFRPRESMPGDHLCIGFVGRLERNKGIFDFIALAERFRHRDDVTFVVCGDGPAMAEAKGDMEAKDLGHKIHFRGFVQDMDAVWTGIDVLVMLSVREAFGLVVLEAIARGVSVISYDRALGGAELVRQLPGGHLVDEADPEAFVRVIDELQANRKAAVDETAQGAEIVREMFSIAAMECRVAAAYAQIFEDEGDLAVQAIDQEGTGPSRMCH